VEHFSRTLSAHELQLVLSTDSEHYPLPLPMIKPKIAKKISLMMILKFKKAALKIFPEHLFKMIA
jgi:hypothetical protein